MKTRLVAALILGLIGLVALDTPVIAGQQYTLEFIPTQNAPAGAQGTMTIKTVNGDTVVHFGVRGAHPNTVYTIWIVYNKLTWPPNGPWIGNSVPSCSISPIPPANGEWCPDPTFPPEGNAVAPLTRLDAAFTSGMGLDPGIVFVTNDNGDGEAQVKLDYNLVWAAPIGNKDIIVQCVPGPLALNGSCPAPSKKINVTTTWLRKYIGQIIAEDKDPAIECANYDPSSPNTLYWQCIDPATVDPNTGSGLPRVYRFEFDHFRLANHLDDLTHGFIGGDKVDHQIDMVGRRCELMPSVGAICP